jgi:hypothetical protein
MPDCIELCDFLPGLTDFSWYMIPKTGKMYQMNKKCTKWQLSFPNHNKIFQMAMK